MSSFCNNKGIECYRGSLENVAKRVLDAANYFNLESFVRINGDSPLLNSKILDQGISIFNSADYDLVTNTSPRSFPVGQSVEVVKTSSFVYAYKKMKNSDDFEHVTKYYYEHPDEFRIRNFSNETNLCNYRLVVDTQDDFNRIQKIIDKMTMPYTEYGLDGLIELYPGNQNL